MLPTLIQRYDKKIISCFIQFKKERLTEVLQAVRCPIFMIVLILYITLLNLSRIKNMSIFEEYGAFKGLDKLGKFSAFFPRLTIF